MKEANTPAAQVAVLKRLLLIAVIVVGVIAAFLYWMGAFDIWFADPEPSRQAVSNGTDIIRRIVAYLDDIAHASFANRAQRGIRSNIESLSRGIAVRDNDFDAHIYTYASQIYEYLGELHELRFALVRQRDVYTLLDQILAARNNIADIIGAERRLHRLQ